MSKKIYHNSYFIFTGLLIVLILLGHFFSFICPYVLKNEECEVKYFENADRLFKVFIIGSVFGPFIETLFFQFLPIILYKKLIKSQSLNSKIIIAVFSSIIFGLTHNYNVLTIIDAVLAGLIFCTIYFHYSEKGKSGFLFTFLIHAAYNTYAFIIDDVLKIA